MGFIFETSFIFSFSYLCYSISFIRIHTPNNLNFILIHNEIVVINICNLGSDTKYFLDLKVQSEELFANTDNPEIIKRYDSFTEMDEVNENSDEDKTEN